LTVKTVSNMTRCERFKGETSTGANRQFCGVLDGMGISRIHSNPRYQVAGRKNFQNNLGE